VIRLFGDACWPQAKDASFTRLRAVGAFTVSASLAGGVVGPVTITSEAGRPVRLKKPWKTGRVEVTTVDGAAVPFTDDGAVVSFATTPGATYTVRVT
jgi:alpha-L-fucosidase 2